MVWTQARIIWYMIQDNRRCVNFGRQLQSYTGISRSFAKKKKKSTSPPFFCFQHRCTRGLGVAATKLLGSLSP